MTQSVARYLKGILVFVFIVLIVSGCEINSVTPAKAADPPSWQIVTSPSPGTQENSLKSISAVSATELYAVGSTDGKSFLLDGNGKTWTQDTSIAYTGKLYSVSADPQGDVYVTGEEAKQDNSTVAFLLYKLKGASTWTRADLPTSSTIGESIKAFSATQVWIAGSTYAHTPYGQGVAWLWNGSTFTPNAMPDPLPDTVQNLSAVTGISASDVWMSGYTTEGASFSAHLEQGTWKPYPVPHPTTLKNSYLMSLSSYGQDVWGVGRDTIGVQPVAYISHFTNGSWSTVYTSPTNSSFLSSVIQTSASDVWAVGSYVSNSQTEPLSLHSTDAGKTWNPVSVPSVDTLSELYSIVDVSGTLWAVGDSSHAGVTQKSLIEAYGAVVTPTPIKPSGTWVYPAKGFTFVKGNTYTIIARGYQTQKTDPAIAYVNVTGFWSNAWHVLCHIPNNRPDLGDYYYCSTTFQVNGKYPPNGKMSISFDVYDAKGNKNLSPNGVHTGTFSLTSTAQSKAVGAINKQVTADLVAMKQNPMTLGQIDPRIQATAQCFTDIGLLKKLSALFGKVGTHTYQMIDRINNVYGHGKTFLAIYKDITTGQFKALVVEIANTVTDAVFPCADMLKYAKPAPDGKAYLLIVL